LECIHLYNRDLHPVGSGWDYSNFIRNLILKQAIEEPEFFDSRIKEEREVGALGSFAVSSLPFLQQQPFRIYSILFVLYILPPGNQGFGQVLIFCIQNEQVVEEPLVR
jgi:hypothetical protein